jgi:hypothetical protein
MKKLKVPLLTLLAVSVILLISLASGSTDAPQKAHKPFVPKACVFRTVFGEESSDSNSIYKTPARVKTSVTRGLEWIVAAQNPNGGWGAGNHTQQHMIDPHAVATDPATTAMVAMALLRSGTTLTAGEYPASLRKALEHLLRAVETADPSSHTITSETGTQIQIKLGQNIDVILTAQLLTNMMETIDNEAMHVRIKKALDICVKKIQNSQETDGSIRGAGWAGVLQSSLASNALESAKMSGVKVDDQVLEKSRAYQKANYDAQTGEINTDKGAGVMLYSVTGSARASASEARRVREALARAKTDGRLAESAPASPENLQRIGFTRDEAMKYATAYEVYESAKVQAQREDVMDGFGSNGGEEFLSYLQTGEGMIINQDNTWKQWYDNISGRLIRVQNNDGSWNGHHCITSPVFCTATCLLILSINEDIDKLAAIGK